MAFSAIPFELFLDIAERLHSDADRQSLRITCRRFHGWIPPPMGTSYFANFATDRVNNEKRAFLRRLFSEGNIFHGRDVEYCGNCICVKPKSRFPMPELRLSYAKVCDECIIEQLRTRLGWGFKLSYPGFDDYYTCRACGYGRLEKNMFAHTQQDVKYDRRLCEDCHKHICRDKQCTGWPEGYVEKHWFHFDLPEPEDTEGTTSYGICYCNATQCYARRASGR